MSTTAASREFTPAAEPRRYTAEEIRRRTEWAARLTLPADEGEPAPAVAVQWAPAAPYADDDADPDQYEVAVNVSDDATRWTIRGETREALGVQYAAGLIETAKYLEDFARQLRVQAQTTRR